MALHAQIAMPSEPGPALRLHLQEHFGVHATLYPRRAPTSCRAPTSAPIYLQPQTEPGIWYYELVPLAKISGAIEVTNAGTTPAGTAMALAYEHAPGQYKATVTSGVETSQEGVD